MTEPRAASNGARTDMCDRFAFQSLVQFRERRMEKQVFYSLYRTPRLQMLQFSFPGCYISIRDAWSPHSDTQSLSRGREQESVCFNVRFI